jgi:CheY-like chemotaxis protein
VTDHASTHAKQGGDRKRLTALLVDGYIRDLYSTGSILQRLDYDVYIVNSAEDALEIINAGPPSLVITEVALPQMSGLELLIRIKQEPRLKGLPSIVHTASEDPKQEQYCRAAGCAAFLRKPVEPDALYAAIQQATETTPRQFIRIRTLLPVMVGGRPSSGGNGGTEYVSELSENGIFIHTLKPRPVNSIAPVTIILRSIPIRLRATVMRTFLLSRGLSREPGMGMKFLDITATDRELIRNFIMGQIMKDVPSQQ